MQSRGRHLVLLLTLTVVITLNIAIWPSVGLRGLDASAPTVSAITAERQGEAEELLEWGLSRYALEGLEQPEVSLRVEATLTPCNGRVGLYDRTTQELTMCRLDAYTVIHELAHAWADQNLTDADRMRFTAHRELEDWNDRGHPWERRATEHAAEVLTWALLEHDRTVPWVDNGITTHRLLTIEQSSPEQLTEAFIELVGRPPRLRGQAGLPDTAVFSPEARRVAQHG